MDEKSRELVLLSLQKCLHAPNICLSEKAMAPHFSTLVWKIPWMEELGGLQSMGLLKVRHEWATELNSPISFVFFLIYIIAILKVWSDISLWVWFTFPWLVMLSIFSYTCWLFLCLSYIARIPSLTTSFFFRELKIKYLFSLQY